MDINNYLYELSACLKQLSHEEREEAFAFYSEYAHEAGMTTYEQMEEHFGTPKALSSKIYAETAAKQLSGDTKGDSNVGKGLLFVFLAILSLPLSLPLAIVVLALVFAFGVTVIALIFSLFVTVVAVGIKGLFLLVNSFFALISSGILAWMETLGDALFHMSSAVFLAVLVYFVSKYSFKWIGMGASKIVGKANRNA